MGSRYDSRITTAAFSREFCDVSQNNFGELAYLEEILRTIIKVNYKKMNLRGKSNCRWESYYNIVVFKVTVRLRHGTIIRTGITCTKISL